MLKNNITINYNKKQNKIKFWYKNLKFEFKNNLIKLFNNLNLIY